MKNILILLAAALLLGGCGHTDDTQKALEAGNRVERGSWLKPNTTVQQTWIDYSVCGSGILYTKEGFSQKDYENDLSICIQAEIERERHIRKVTWIPGFGDIARLATLSAERCMKPKGYTKVQEATIKGATSNEISECMKSKGYEWKQ